MKEGKKAADSDENRDPGGFRNLSGLMCYTGSTLRSDDLMEEQESPFHPIPLQQSLVLNPWERDADRPVSSTPEGWLPI